MSSALLGKVVKIIAQVDQPDLAAELVLAVARDVFFEEFQLEQKRATERERKRRQRDKDGTSGGTGGGKQAGQSAEKQGTVSPAPPSGLLFSDPVSSPDLSKPDLSDRGNDERPGPLTRYSSNFVAFWLAYPHKVGKEAAWKAWKKHCPQLPVCIAALNWQKGSKRWREGIIPNPATWINEHRWLDERDNRGDIAGTRAPPEVKPQPTTPPRDRGWT